MWYRLRKQMRRILLHFVDILYKKFWQTRNVKKFPGIPDRELKLSQFPGISDREFPMALVGPPTRNRKFCHFAGSKRRRCLLMVGKDGEMFMTRSFYVTPKTTEQHLIARSDKSVAYVTNYSMAWKFVNSLSPKWPHWTLLLTDFLWSSSAPVILKFLNLARNSLALNYLALCCPNA